MQFVDRYQAGESISRHALASDSLLLLAKQRELFGDAVRAQYKHRTARAVPLFDHLTVFRPKHQGRYHLHSLPEASSL